MPDFINLTCPSCGGKLQITNDIDRFACGHCGNELIVRRSGGAITVAPIVEGLKEVKTGVDKTASELAMVRLEGEISRLSQQRNSIHDNSSCITILFFLVSGMLLFSFVFSGIVVGFGKVETWILFLASMGFGLATYISNLVISPLHKKYNDDIKVIDQMLADKKRELEKHRNIVRNI
jgi:hypothetical protein